MLDSTGTNLVIDKPVKILIVDDNPIFYELIGTYAEMLGYIWEAANDLKAAMLAIKEAEESKQPFSVVTIDMKFETGQEAPMLLGKTILQKIKTQYPHIACVMISGSGLTAHEALDLRDEYGLDYYISKDRLDPDTLQKGLEKALGRVRPLGSIDKLREVLEETLTKYKEICAVFAHNLANVEQKKAEQGIDVSVKIENEIESYREQLEQAKKKVKELEKEIKQLETD